MNDHDHCTVCSALDSDIENHEKWHCKLDEAIELAVRQQQVVRASDRPEQVIDGGTL